MSDVLVLNKAYVPVHIISWQRAISLMYTDHAEALDQNYQSYTFSQWNESEHDPSMARVHSVNSEIVVPSVIRLKIYNHLPKQAVRFSRQNIFQRDQHICQYCGGRFHRQDLTKDHIIPKSKGGENTWDNIVTCCKTCNRKKGDRSLQECGMKLLKLPIEPSWIMIVHKRLSHNHCREEWNNFLKYT